ncbi:DUF3298 and DUF4163 domain-containing protein [Mucilaginibacter sp. BJC16-A38]|uniref:DUF3298 and DUF4163 domain-containing protein n=1 Tax=Mucilaginibacter phenanthrenivorans TaxID=1234842 RepID=UPI00215812B2|nr:DUF3298 and DUF4163 domain-containing protein [Mucilaginibacter phenanthrenivorans]MCR8560586.1 DUF3298 and DUF4163 domain-containing protein [Mucilaginibacter phenanthrenivorans]
MKLQPGVFCLVAIAISGCMWGKPGTTKSAINTDTLAFKYTVFKQRAADCGEKADTACTVVKFKYPDFTGQKKLNDTIVQKLVNLFQLSEKPDTSLKELSKNFMANYLSAIKENSAEMFYSLDCYTKIIRQDSSLTTLEIGGYSYMGGAHPSSFTGFINWNTKADKIITLDDLIAPVNKAKLASIAEHIFRASEKLADTASLANNYFFKDNKFALNDNFSITPTGLRFLYNQYEIKPYAAGTTELIIPYAKIKSLLLPNTILTQYIK